MSISYFSENENDFAILDFCIFRPKNFMQNMTMDIIFDIIKKSIKAMFGAQQSVSRWWNIWRRSSEVCSHGKEKYKFNK